MSISIKRIIKSLKCFKDSSGNISIMFAVLIPVLILMLGGIIDWSLTNYKKTKIQHATDMAILASLKVFTDKNIPEDERLERANKIAADMMNANLYSEGVNLDSFKITVKKNDDGDNVAVVDWKVKIPTNFLKLAGLSNLEISDHVEAVLGASTSKFVDLYIMVDVSSSMGIPATPAGIARLKRERGCEFSCHRTYSYNQYARANGIQLRMDVVRSAIKDIALKIKTLKSVRTNQYRVGLYSFTTSAKTVLEPSEDMDLVVRTAESIGVENAHTILAAGMKHLKQVVGKQGKGTSDDDRIKLAVFLSDGLHDESTRWPYYTKSIGDVNCTLGQGGDEVKLMGVYTTYEPFNSRHYDSMVRPHKSRLAPDFRNCATEGSFYETSNASDIKKAFDDIFVEFTIAGDLALTR